MRTHVNRTFAKLERRTERLTADLGMPLLVSADVLASAPGVERELQSTPLSPRLLRGRSQPISLYQLDGNAKQVEDSEELKASTLADTH